MATLKVEIRESITLDNNNYNSYNFHNILQSMLYIAYLAKNAIYCTFAKHAIYFMKILLNQN